FLSSSFSSLLLAFFFSHDTPTTEIYTLSLHDALPISIGTGLQHGEAPPAGQQVATRLGQLVRPLGGQTHARSDGDGCIRMHVAKDRKSTRLNSSHVKISYAVFCLKKKKKTEEYIQYSS